MITNILFNSSTSKIYTDGANQNLYFNIDVPPIDISKSAILKVANFCHTGSATNHTENIYIFKIRGINVDNSKFLYNIDGNPVILSTTFNNNRSIYEENEIKLTKQTINNIDIICDTLSPDGYLSSVNINSGGSGYLAGQILTLTGGGGSNASMKISSVNSGEITKIDVLNSGSSFSSIPSLSTSINGSGAVLIANLLSSSVNTITISNGGVGYKAGQSLIFTGGGYSTIAVATIATVNALGAILTFTISSGGAGYSSAPIVDVNSTTQTQTAIITPVMKFGVISSGIPNTLNFCMSLRIEEDIDE